MRPVILLALLALSGCVAPASTPPTPDVPLVTLAPPDFLRLEECHGVGLRLLGPGVAGRPSLPPAFASRGSPADATHLQLDAVSCTRATTTDRVVADVGFAYAFVAVTPKDDAWGRPGALAQYVVAAITDSEALAAAFLVAGIATDLRPVRAQSVAAGVEAWTIGDAEPCEIYAGEARSVPRDEHEARDLWSGRGPYALASVAHEATTATALELGAADLSCLPNIANPNGGPVAVAAGVRYERLSWSLPSLAQTFGETP